MENHELDRLRSATSEEEVLSDPWVATLLKRIRSNVDEMSDVRGWLLMLWAELGPSARDGSVSQRDLVLRAIIWELAEGQKPWKVKDEEWIWLIRPPLDYY